MSSNQRDMSDLVMVPVKPLMVVPCDCISIRLASFPLFTASRAIYTASSYFFSWIVMARPLGSVWLLQVGVHLDTVPAQ